MHHVWSGGVRSAASGTGHAGTGSLAEHPRAELCNPLGAPIRCGNLILGRETALLREVDPQDIAIFFEQQDDPVASAMAAFPSRDRAAHDVHWARILADDSLLARTIVEDGQVVGNIGIWVADGERSVGYWIGRPYWGRGYATRALAEFVAEVRERPLHARVAEHNVGSIRVLAKCGFWIVGEEQHDGDPVKEIVMRLDA